MAISRIGTFADLKIEIHEDGHVWVRYGPAMGAEKFDREWEALEALDDWSDKEFSRLTKKLEGIAKLRRYIRRNLGGRR
ncbi:MAG: hypothetical protein KAI41_08785 [Hyphomicrobiaceae bacterium]|nr:hypothetical protein [Hyphomicrobiaceae bacterium]MCK5550613.1 hypothetical protein [Hyphomicrobiaceae bacterium]